MASSRRRFRNSRRSTLPQKVLNIPIRNHYEQECNAAALKKMGVPTAVKPTLTNNPKLARPTKYLSTTIIANNIPDSISIDTYQF
jgi:hypothetical protein